MLWPVVALERVLVFFAFELLLLLAPLLLLALALLWFLAVEPCEGRGVVAAEDMGRPVVSSVPWL